MNSVFKNGLNFTPFGDGEIEGALIERKKMPEIDPYEKYSTMSSNERHAQLESLMTEIKVLRNVIKEKKKSPIGKRYFEAKKKQLLKQAKDQYGDISLVINKSFDESFTIENGKIYFWFNIANHSTKMVHTEI